MDPVAGRFVIERDAGAGGMARVYRARDLTTDRVVALKLLTRMADTDLKRFTREVSALSELRDAAIPQYIAHGFTQSGEPYLAMEWLDGEPLDAVLARGPLDVGATLAIGRAVAGGLAAAHARGIIHRDVKPGNVFLVGGEPSRAKLIDFGIARDTLSTLGLTSTGDLLGTPLYMAPEQARGELDLDPRVDVYALGTLLFACLAGRPPFLASTLVALLAKIAVEDAPSLAANAPDVPAALDELVARMLAKHRGARPANASIVAVELDALRDGLAPAVRPAATLASVKEQRVVSILLATGVEGALATDETGLDLADGSSLVTFTGPESPSDLATRAVRYALGMASPASAIALATGRAVIRGGTPVGEVIERAGRQLSRAGGAIRIDDDTAGLVEGRFELVRDALGAKVLGERDASGDALRTLLGKPTRCVGRDRELAAMEGHYAEVVGESIARAVLVFAEPGVGKSRFGREVVRRLASRDDAPAVLLVRGEPAIATTPFAALASALRKALAAPIADEFLAELAGAPHAAASDQMRAARESPLLMFEQLRRAWTEWLARAAAGRPQLIVVEDLQWVDAQSILLLDAALAGLAEQPLLVLGVGRPEARAHGVPWAAHRPHELRLDPLPRRASERLVRDALGPDASDTVVEQIVGRAAGNALFLEELVRAFSQSVTSLPVGVIGTVQLRLDALRPEARAALRAASVLGEQFRATGVAALLGRADVGGVLDELVAHELVVPGDDAFAFRHALVREAAYALLADEDLRLAHGLAAAYLERDGTAAAADIAHHHQLARHGEEAAAWYVRAAEHSLAHNDLAGALVHARHALAWTTHAPVRGAAEHVMAEAELWRANLAAARASARHAADHLPTGAVAWFEAVGLLITTAGQLGDNDTVITWVEHAMANEPDAEAVSPFANCVARAASQLFMTDRGDVAERAIVRLEAVIADRALSPHAQARVEIARGYAQLYRGAMDVCTDYVAKAVAIYERVGARRDALQAEVMRGSILCFAGALDEARATLCRAIDEATRIETSYLVEWARWQLGLVETIAGDPDASRAYLDSVEPRVASQPLFIGGTTCIRGWFALAARDLSTVDALLERVRDTPLAARYRATFAIYAARARQLRGDTDGVEAIAREHLDVLAQREGMRADVHLAGISVALDILRDTGPIPELVAHHQRHLRAVAGAFDRPDAGVRFLALPWLQYVMNLPDSA